MPDNEQTQHDLDKNDALKRSDVDENKKEEYGLRI